MVAFFPQRAMENKKGKHRYACPERLPVFPYGGISHIRFKGLDDGPLSPGAPLCALLKKYAFLVQL
jgi:hypothetical protein